MSNLGQLIGVFCKPGSRTEDKVKVDMEGEGDGLEDEDVEEEEDAVGENGPCY